MCKQYSIKTSTTKTKVMGFQGKEPIRTKIMLNDRILEQVSYFIYLGNDIGYDIIYDIDVKLGKIQTICGTINRLFRNKLSRDKKIKVLQRYGSPCTCLLYTSRCV